MRVIQFSAYGPPEVLSEAEAALPIPGPDEVLIKVLASGVNPADGKWRSGMFRDFIPLSLPHVPGYDVAGLVAAVGEGVERFAVGDRVVTMLNPMIGGGYADHVVSDAVVLARVPDGVDLNEAAALPTPCLTAVQMISEHIRPEPGERVLITGALGAVGRFLVQTALDAGAVVIAAVRPDQQEEVLALGASVAIPLGKSPPASLGIDHLADTVGGAAVAALCRLVPPGGRIVTVATTPIDASGLAVSPTSMAVRPDGPMLTDIIRKLAQGQISTLPVRVMPWSGVAEAHRLVEAGGLRSRIVLTP